MDRVRSRLKRVYMKSFLVECVVEQATRKCISSPSFLCRIPGRFFRCAVFSTSSDVSSEGADYSL